MGVDVEMLTLWDQVAYNPDFGASGSFFFPTMDTNAYLNAYDIATGTVVYTEQLPTVTTPNFFEGGGSYTTSFGIQTKNIYVHFFDGTIGGWDSYSTFVSTPTY
jgi:hypothetical protein